MGGREALRTGLAGVEDGSHAPSTHVHVANVDEDTGTDGLGSEPRAEEAHEGPDVLVAWKGGWVGGWVGGLYIGR